MTIQPLTSPLFVDITSRRRINRQPDRVKRHPSCHESPRLGPSADGRRWFLRQRPMAATFRILAFAAAAGLLAPFAHAGEPRSGHYQYSIRHALFGEIGSQSIDLVRHGHEVTVTVDARVKIKLLFLTLLRLRTRGREVWRDGRMIAFDGLSEEDGDVITVSARAVPEGTMFEGPKGKTDIPGPVALTNPWSRAVLDVPIMIEPTSGSLLSIRSRREGWQWIEARGRTVKPRKYAVTGDMAASVWFSEDGTFARMEFFKAGEPLARPAVFRKKPR